VTYIPDKPDDSGNIISNIGKSETKMGLAASDTEIKVVNE
jgi:hypothetical protein